MKAGPCRARGNTAPSQAVGYGPLSSPPGEGAGAEAEPCPSLTEVAGAGQRASKGPVRGGPRSPGLPPASPPPDPSEIPLIPQPRLDSVPII